MKSVHHNDFIILVKSSHCCRPWLLYDVNNILIKRNNKLKEGNKFNLELTNTLLYFKKFLSLMVFISFVHKNKNKKTFRAISEKANI